VIIFHNAIISSIIIAISLLIGEYYNSTQTYEDFISVLVIVVVFYILK